MKFRNKNKKSPIKPTNTKILLKLEKLIDKWEEARVTDTHIFLTNPKKAIWANIIIGISRGVGFVLGVSIIGGIVLTIIGSVLSKFASVPLIGEYIAMIVQQVQEYLKNKSF